MIICESVSVQQRIRSISQSFSSGQLSVILGENGAGKSTLLEVIAGLESPDQGHVLLQHQTINQGASTPVSSLSLGQLASIRAWVAQHNGLQFSLTGADMLGLYHQPSADIILFINQFIAIEHLLGKPFLQLSGGEQRLVCIARALIQIQSAIERHEAVVLLDEPLAGLDLRYQLQVMSLLNQVAKEGNTVVITAHDPFLANDFAQTLVWLKAGKLIQNDKKDAEISMSILSQCYDLSETQLMYYKSRISTKSPS